MIPLVDMHCHLLAGLDDGPRTEEDALAMCRTAYAQGVRMAAATAHQNERWPAVTPDLIREAVHRLGRQVQGLGLSLLVFPSAEVTVHPEIASSWRNGHVLSVADRRQYLLLEMPHALFVDLRKTIQNLRREGICPILAHPERHAELLHEPGQIEQLIRAGCLIQVSSASITEPRSWPDERAVRSWVKRGVVHVLGSDGHSPLRRPPKMAEAYHRITQWAGTKVADRVCSINGMALLQGVPLSVPSPEPYRSRWVPKFW
jgi:protein-tyrosine phosphatase